LASVRADRREIATIIAQSPARGQTGWSYPLAGRSGETCAARALGRSIAAPNPGGHARGPQPASSTAMKMSMAEIIPMIMPLWSVTAR